MPTTRSEQQLVSDASAPTQGTGCRRCGSVLPLDVSRPPRRVCCPRTGVPSAPQPGVAGLLRCPRRRRPLLREGGCPLWLEGARSFYGCEETEVVLFRRGPPALRTDAGSAGALPCRAPAPLPCDAAVSGRGRRLRHVLAIGCRPPLLLRSRGALQKGVPTGGVSRSPWGPVPSRVRAGHRGELVATTEACRVCVAGVSTRVAWVPALLRPHVWLLVGRVAFRTALVPARQETQGPRAACLTCRVVPVPGCPGRGGGRSAAQVRAAGSWE